MDRSDGTRAERHCNARYVRGSKNVFRGVVCLNAVMSLVINMYLCVYVCACIHIREEGEKERIYRRPIIIHSRDTGFGYSDEQTSVTRPALLAHSFPRAMT